MISLYIIVFFIVAIFALMTIIKPQLDKSLYYMSLGILTLFICLRFGQGPDYPGYMYIYELADRIFETGYGLKGYLEQVHSEIGWKFCSFTFNYYDVVYA